MEFRLFYMGDVDGMSAQQFNDAEDFIVAREYTVICTVDPSSGARISALSNLPGQTIRELFFATEAGSRKVKNLQADPRCELMYTNGGGQVMLSGTAEVITDVATKKALWQDWMTDYFPEGPEGQSCIIRFKTANVRAMLE